MTRIAAFLAITCLSSTLATADNSTSPAKTSAWTFYPPLARADAPAAYDSKRQRMIVFGGVSGPYTNETWAFNFRGDSRWDRIAPAEGAPHVIGGHLVYDPVRDRVLLFFGQVENLPSTDVWSLSLTGAPHWSLVEFDGESPPGSGPPVYDPLRDRVLALGTGTFQDTLHNGVYAFVSRSRERASWQRLTYDLPKTLRLRSRFSVIHDTTHDQLVLFGGGLPPRGCFDFDTCIQRMNDVWSLDLRDSTSEWSQAEPSGGPPTPRVAAFAAFDATQNQMVVYGGSGPFDSVLGDTWTLSLGGHQEWNEISDLGIEAPDRGSVVWDSEQRGVVQFSGVTAPKHASFLTSLGNVDGTIRELSLESGDWQVVGPDSAAPPARNGHTLTYDTRDRQWILFGGTEEDSGRVWVLPDRGQPRWRTLQTRGAEPAARAFHSAVYDSLTNSLLVFGGLDMRTGASLNDTWRLSLGDAPAWTRLQPDGVPPSPRYRHGAIYDLLGHRMIVYGGWTMDTPTADDLWQLAFEPKPHWSLMDPAGTTPGGRVLAFFYDPNRNRCLLLGGQSVESFVWTLDLSDPPVWQLVEVANGPPLRANAAAFDVKGERVLALGNSNEPWELPLSPPMTWRSIPISGDAPGGLRSGSPIACDSRGEEIVLFGGRVASWSFSDLWTLSLPKSSAHPNVELAQLTYSPSSFSLAAPYPSPSRSGVAITYTQPTSAYVTIRVFDSTGRLIRSLFDGTAEAGTHEISWDGLDARGSRAKAGVYFSSMNAGGWSATRKFVLISP